MKHHNPHTPIMIREALNTQPRVFARYEFGREKMADLAGKDTHGEGRSCRSDMRRTGEKRSMEGSLGPRTT